jgi:DNA-binding CsgD family transcriptional regulator
MAQWNLQAVGEALAAAAIGSSDWISAVQCAAEQTGSVGALLLPLDGRLPHVPFTSSVGGSTEHYFREGWVHRDLRVYGLHHLFDRGAFSDLDIVTPEQVARTAYYQDFLRPHGLRWFAGVSVACGEERWCLSIQRSIAQGPCSPEEMSRLAAASRGFGATAALARALGFAQASTVLAAMDAADVAVALIDRGGCVFRLNAAAEALVADGAVSVLNRRLVAATRPATDAFDRMLHRLLWTSAPDALSPPIRLPRLDGRRPVLAHPLRLPRFGENPFAPALVALVLRDLEARPRPAVEDLMLAFGMTAAEARVARGLAGGQSLDAVHRALAISMGTARVHLRSIFQKTNTSRQGELVAALALLRRGPSVKRD